MKRLILLAAIAATALAAAPVRVLIVTGASDTQYHDWRISTPFFKRTLEASGRFEVRVTEEPRGLSREALEAYDVIFLNYNGPRWGTVPEAALEEFVRSGKGLVSFHGVTYGPLMGTVLRADGKWEKQEPWTAYTQMLGVTWEPENIGHAVRHAFVVKADSTHPIALGLPAQFTVNDELYHKMKHAPGNRVVLRAFSNKTRGGTGNVEPIAWTTQFGKGRVFHCSLGHDVSALYEPHVLGLIARATEWAGTGEVTLPAVRAEQAESDSARVLVATGGHGYDPSFYEVFNRMQGIRWSHATSQREAFTPDMAERFDVLVLYDMYNTIGEAEQRNLRAFVEAGKGVVSLHHSIVDYTSWPWWYQEVIGGKYFEKAEAGHAASRYKEGVPLILRPAKGQENHPMVRGLGEIVTEDECYKGMWHSPKITVLMETDAPCNDRPAVYIGPRGNAVYVQLGHGTYTHEHPGYRSLVRNAILWVSGRLR
jgi:type 1 glutamine amidotransferase